jgi:hypothetical protein
METRRQKRTGGSPKVAVLLQNVLFIRDIIRIRSEGRQSSGIGEYVAKSILEVPL